RSGDDPAGFFGSFTRSLEGADATVAFDYVPAVLITCVLVWLAVIAVMVFGVPKGIAGSAMVFIPLVVSMFIILVARALMLPGALGGLDAFFRPNCDALLSPPVWVAVAGQIAFSLSVALGLLLPCASYLQNNADLTCAGLVARFPHSGFEILAGIVVFPALGVMAQAQGVAVDDVVASGIGVAFMAFPALIGEAPAGGVIG